MHLWPCGGQRKCLIHGQSWSFIKITEYNIKKHSVFKHVSVSVNKQLCTCDWIHSLTGIFLAHTLMSASWSGTFSVSGCRSVPWTILCLCSVLFIILFATFVKHPSAPERRYINKTLLLHAAGLVTLLLFIFLWSGCLVFFLVILYTYCIVYECTACIFLSLFLTHLSALFCQPLSVYVFVKPVL